MIDIFGERLFEGYQKAYLLKFDNYIEIYKVLGIKD